MHAHAYWKLGIMTALSFVAMYFLMYLMVSRIDYVYMNLNMAYMAAAMAMPMVPLMLLLMSGMYESRAANLLFGAGSIVLLILFILFTRQQTAIGDTQFLRSMIPHHSGAILMCERAQLTDPRIVELCATIIEAQQEEINEMEAILRDYR